AGEIAGAEQQLVFIAVGALACEVFAESRLERHAEEVALFDASSREALIELRVGHIDANVQVPVIPRESGASGKLFRTFPHLAAGAELGRAVESVDWGALPLGKAAVEARGRGHAARLEHGIVLTPQQ